METNFVIIGLPASGKTTFLAALWHLVEADEVACRLRLDRYEGDLSYLNRIAEAWRTFKPVPRTSQVGDRDVVIHLIDGETGKKAAAFFPDLAGEVFDTQVELRRCRPSFVESVDGGTGVLLFVSADRREDDLSIVELNRRLPPEGAGLDNGHARRQMEPKLATALGGEGAADHGETKAVDGKPLEWNPKTIPAQVRLVQLLTDLARTPFEPKRRRLAVLVSAWDLVAASGMTPAQWLDSHTPLLSQFLAANTPVFDVATYGVSAQGVRLNDGGAVDRAADMSPSERIKVVSADGEANDLTLPLLWLMSPS